MPVTWDTTPAVETLNLSVTLRQSSASDTIQRQQVTLQLSTTLFSSGKSLLRRSQLSLKLCASLFQLQDKQHKVSLGRGRQTTDVEGHRQHVRSIKAAYRRFCTALVNSYDFPRHFRIKSTYLTYRRRECKMFNKLQCDSATFFV